LEVPDEEDDEEWIEASNASLIKAFSLHPNTRHLNTSSIHNIVENILYRYGESEENVKAPELTQEMENALSNHHSRLRKMGKLDPASPGGTLHSPGTNYAKLPERGVDPGVSYVGSNFLEQSMASMDNAKVNGKQTPRLPKTPRSPGSSWFPTMGMGSHFGLFTGETTRPAQVNGRRMEHIERQIHHEIDLSSNNPTKHRLPQKYDEV